MFKTDPMNRSMSRKPVETQPSNHSHQEKLIHSIALTLLGGSDVEVAAVLNALLTWSNPSFKLEQQQSPHTQQIRFDAKPKPTPILVQSLARFLVMHINEWEKGPSVQPALIVLTVINNLLYSSANKINLENAAIFASNSEMMNILQRLSFHPYSPLTILSQQVLIMLARFCDIDKVIENKQRFVDNISSLFMLSDPATDDQLIIIQLNFMLFPKNLSLLMDELGADMIVSRLSQLLSYPSSSLRDTILEVTYALVMTTPEIKEEVCKNNQIIRQIVTFCIPQFEPTEQKSTIPLSPCQKACAFLIELLDDSRVLQFVGRFKVQLATVALKWKSAWLTELATKVSNVTGR